jgi:hypothetical protein
MKATPSLPPKGIVSSQPDTPSMQFNAFVCTTLLCTLNNMANSPNHSDPRHPPQCKFQTNSLHPQNNRSAHMQLDASACMHKIPSNPSCSRRNRNIKCDSHVKKMKNPPAVNILPILAAMAITIDSTQHYHVKSLRFFSTSSRISQT